MNINELVAQAKQTDTNKQVARAPQASELNEVGANEAPQASEPTSPYLLNLPHTPDPDQAAAILKIMALVEKAERNDDLTQPYAAATAQAARTDECIKYAPVNKPTLHGTTHGYIRAHNEAVTYAVQGAAGTGKTTILAAALINIGRYFPNLSVAVIAPTGKAAINAKRVLVGALKDIGAPPEALNVSFETAHAYLRYVRKDKDGRTLKVFVPKYNSMNKRPTRVVFIDEMSMQGMEIAHNLIKAHNSNTIFISFGDLWQVQPVADLSAAAYNMYIRGSEWRSVLTKVHRYDGWVLKQAHRVIQGKIPLAEPVNPNEAKFVLRKLKKNTGQASSAFIAYIKKLHKAGMYDPALDVIITPMNKGYLGQTYLNQELSACLNPQAHELHAVVDCSYGRKLAFALGDQVQFGVNAPKDGYVNGTEGVIKGIAVNWGYEVASKASRPVLLGSLPREQEEKAREEREANGADVDATASEDAAWEFEAETHQAPANQAQASHVLMIEYTCEYTGKNKAVKLKTAADIGKLNLSYARTIYKAQGSGFRNVFVLIHHSLRKGCNREYVYTALTRTQQRCIVWHCSDEMLQDAVNKQALKGSTIEAKLITATGTGAGNFARALKGDS